MQRKGNMYRSHVFMGCTGSSLDALYIDNTSANYRQGPMKKACGLVPNMMYHNECATVIIVVISI